jgi:hypothetical protein
MDSNYDAAKGTMIRPAGSQPPTGLSTARVLATLRAFLNMVCLTVALAFGFAVFVILAVVADHVSHHICVNK